MWISYKNNSTIGEVGSERGIIIKDEEYNGEARVTLEHCKNQPNSHIITIGVYGLLLHTVFCSSLKDANTRITDIKIDIEKLLDDLLLAEDLGDLIEEFVKKY